MAPGGDGNTEPTDDLDSAPRWVRHLINAVQPPKAHNELDHPVDEPIVVAAAQVALAAKIEAVNTVRATLVRMAETDHPPQARTA